MNRVLMNRILTIRILTIRLLTIRMLMNRMLMNRMLKARAGVRGGASLLYIVPQDFLTNFSEYAKIQRGRRSQTQRCNTKV